MYSLTLDEVQNQLGEPLGSMNLDELLKTIDVDNDASASSAFSSSHFLRKKTIGEVWTDIQLQQQKKIPQRQFTFGEMTLEDFLLSARSVVDDSNQQNVMQFQLITSQQQQQHDASMFQPLFLARNGNNIEDPTAAMSVIEGPYSSYDGVDQRMNNISPIPSFDTTKSDKQVQQQLPTRRKMAATGDAVEKIVERRHKRMIKNRESAARSRARKQAYTHELEIKVAVLEDENKMLRRHTELGKVMPNAPNLEVRHQLRRTSSTPF